MVANVLVNEGIEQKEAMAYRHARQVTGANLALLGEGFVIWPIEDRRGKGIAGDVLDLSTHGKGTA